MKKNNSIILLVLIFTVISIFKSFAKDSKWSLVDSIDKNSRLYYMNMKCADSLNCMIWAYINPNIGFAFRGTTDGGLTWKTSYTNMESNLSDIAYPDTNLFIGVGSSGVIVRSTDKGETWERNIYDTNSRLGIIRMMDKNFGIIDGCKGNCYGSDFFYLETTNGGSTWEKLNLPVMFDIYDLQMLNKNLFCGFGRIITKEGKWKTYLTWVYDNWKSFDTLNINDSTGNISFINDKIGWGGGYN